MLLTDKVWISGIQGALSVAAISDYLDLWDLLSAVVMHQDVEDSHIYDDSLNCSLVVTRASVAHQVLGSTSRGNEYFRI